MTSGWITIDVPVHYVDFGGSVAGGTVVCVHGLGGSHLNWAALAPKLAQHRRVIALDLVGAGRTTGTTAHASRSAHVDHNRVLLTRFLAEIAPGPAVLVGHSMGALLSLRHAVGNPDTVAAVAVIAPPSPAGWRSLPAPNVIRGFAPYLVPAIGMARLAAQRRRQSPQEIMERILRLCCAHPDRLDPHLVRQHLDLAIERESLIHRDREFAIAAASTLRALARRRSLAAVRHGVRAPVLLIHGARDCIVPVRAVRHVARDHPDWAVRVAPDVGHLPHMEDPTWTAATIDEWLDSVLQPAARDK